MKAQYGVAIDQDGNRFYFGKHCRKDLAAQIPGRVSKLWQDLKSGETVQVGYVIGRQWLTVYAPVHES